MVKWEGTLWSSVFLEPTYSSLNFRVQWNFTLTLKRPLCQKEQLKNTQNSHRQNDGRRRDSSWSHTETVNFLSPNHPVPLTSHFRIPSENYYDIVSPSSGRTRSELTRTGEWRRTEQLRRARATSPDLPKSPPPPLHLCLLQQLHSWDREFRAPLALGLGNHDPKAAAGKSSKSSPLSSCSNCPIPCLTGSAAFQDPQVTHRH